MRKPLQNYVMTSLVFAMSSVHTLARQYLGLAGLAAQAKAMRDDTSTVVLYFLLIIDMLYSYRVPDLPLGPHAERVALTLLERQHRVGRLQALREENNNRLADD